MLAYTREKLLDKLQLTPAILDLYQQQNPSFASEVLSWLSSVEEVMSRLRLSQASQITVEKGKVLAVMAGIPDQSFAVHRLSQRKLVQASALFSLGRAQEAVQQKIQNIDQQFEIWREKMAQYLAIATSRVPIPLPPSEPREAWLKSVWSLLNINGETQNMYRYLNTALQPADRNYLLSQLLDNLLQDL